MADPAPVGQHAYQRTGFLGLGESLEECAARGESRNRYRYLRHHVRGKPELALVLLMAGLNIF